jgi:cytosine deaminase
MELIIRDARAHPTADRRPEPVDVGIEAGRIVRVGPRGSLAEHGARVLEAEGRLVSPPLVDPHVHLDAVLTVGQPRHNESGTLIEGILTWAERKRTLTHEDVKRRAREAIHWEVAQGTGLIRSHVDICDPALVALRALLDLREEVRDIVELQLIAFPQDGILSFPDGPELMREAMRLGCDVIGGIPHYEWTREDGLAEVQFIFDLARETGNVLVRYLRYTWSPSEARYSAGVR